MVQPELSGRIKLRLNNIMTGLLHSSCFGKRPNLRAPNMTTDPIEKINKSNGKRAQGSNNDSLPDLRDRKKIKGYTLISPRLKTRWNHNQQRSLRHAERKHKSTLRIPP